MWDEKRKTIWLATALVLVTLVVVPQAYDDDGRFDVGYFILLELIFIAVVVTMFYFYTKKDGKN
jgi:hypothetical protein